MASRWSLLKHLWRLRATPIVAKRRGGLFLLAPRDLIDTRLLAGQPYENAQIAKAESLIAARNIDLVIDIGANFGLYTILLGKLDQVREVIAFEPVRATCNKLNGNVFLNGLDAKVVAHQIALSDHAGEAEIHIDPRSTGISRFDLSDARKKLRAFKRTEAVRLERFDDVVSAAGRKAFVKIDVEGHSGEVLAGMPRFLAEAEAVVQVEVFERDREAVYSRLEKLGYRKFDQIEADHYFAKG
jgi:FkbM family methyltransferase